MKKFLEKISEGVLFASSTVSTLTVLLIIVFLFKEGLGLFGKTPTEEGFAVAVNKNNPVDELSPDQIRNIFDQNITNWKEVGGNADSIILFRMDDLFNWYSEEELAGIETDPNLLTQKIGEVVDRNKGVIAFISSNQIDKKGPVKLVTIAPIDLPSFFGGKEWFPTAQPVAQFGILPLIMGTLWISLLAILIALPFGLATAIYLAEIAKPGIRRYLKPVIELLAGIPSVVYGFFGLIVIVPLVQQVFDLPVGETGLAGSIVLAIMALPTIITVAEDAMRNTPRSIKEASLALGATRWQTIARVVVPNASSGITAAVILGIGRAIGETMAVLMVTGNAAVIPHSILEPMRTIPATIAAELGEAAKGSLHYDALFALGCILFIITMVINIAVEFISRKERGLAEAFMKINTAKKIQQAIAFNLFRLLSFVLVCVLISILSFIIIRGIGVVNWDFISKMPADGMTKGGILPAIVGTMCLVAGSMLFAFPLGVLSGIYINEYTRDNFFKRFIKLMTNNLAGVPSIVFGLFGMSLFVNTLGFGDSIVAGSLTLGLLTLPVIIRTTEEALKSIEKSYREGSYALGATKLQTIQRVVLPMAMPNVMTGLILSIGRVSGETAPILFTVAAYFLPRLPSGIFDQVMALPYHLYVLSTSGTNMEESRAMAYGTALILILMVLVLNLIANTIRRTLNKRVKTD